MTTTDLQFFGSKIFMGPKLVFRNLLRTPQKDQTKPNLSSQACLTYQNKSTKPNLLNQAYQTIPRKLILPNLPNKTYQVQACPELGTVQPRLVGIVNQILWYQHRNGTPSQY